MGPIVSVASEIPNSKYPEPGDAVGIVVAAGSGERMGGEPKAFIEVLGRPMIMYSLEVLDRSPGVGQIVVVVPADRILEARKIAESVVTSKLVTVCGGGSTRRASVLAGLEAVEERELWTLVQDAARPCLTAELVARGLEAGRGTGAATAAIQSRDTIKEVGSGGVVLRTLDRSKLYQSQTPQVFATETLIRAHREAPPDLLLDDGSLLEAIGFPVHVYEGDPRNLKVTTPADLELVEAVLRKRVRE